MRNRGPTSTDAAVEELREMIRSEFHKRTDSLTGRLMTPELLGHVASIVRQTLEASDYSGFYREHVAVKAEADEVDRNKVVVTLIPKTEIGRKLLEALNDDSTETDR